MKGRGCQANGRLDLVLLRTLPVLPGMPDPEDSYLARQKLVTDEIATRAEGDRKLAHIKGRAWRSPDNPS